MYNSDLTIQPFVYCTNTNTNTSTVNDMQDKTDGTLTRWHGKQSVDNTNQSEHLKDNTVV